MAGLYTHLYWTLYIIILWLAQYRDLSTIVCVSGLTINLACFCDHPDVQMYYNVVNSLASKDWLITLAINLHTVCGV